VPQQVELCSPEKLVAVDRNRNPQTIPLEQESGTDVSRSRDRIYGLLGFAVVFAIVGLSLYFVVRDLL
jgi:hypothetical protein